MIESTFLHIAGVGPHTEQQLWRKGITSWNRLEELLLTGVRVQELLRRNRFIQPTLFTLDHPDLRDARSIEWLQSLELSRAALRDREYAFFLDRLDPSDHWRLLADSWHDALYLDIETTGLARDFHHTTVIGALKNGKFYQWVWPEPLGQFFQLVLESSLVVTFNGRRFDVPFLERQFGQFPVPRAHIDLLDAARAAGYSGGQKELEALLALERENSLRGIGGEEAVQLWSHALYGDEASLERLLAYNRADVEMLPRIAEVLCGQLLSTSVSTMKRPAVAMPTTVELAHPPISFAEVQREWKRRRAGLHLLQPKILDQLTRKPVIVGIDLRGNPNNPTGWARCVGETVETRVLYDNDAIIAATIEADPDLISIDAPLFLPRGRQSVKDDSPCREAGGIVREAERVLWSRGISVYPALIKHMQGLTQRGIELTRCFRGRGITVIESYPGAAQDILGIARKGKSPYLLQRGLEEFGFLLRPQRSHDELDAVTSALVGSFFLAGDYEAIGAADEGYMIIPRIPTTMRWTGEELPCSP